MKKLGLVSIATAVALSSSVYAAEFNFGADATVKGEYRKFQNEEANERYTLEANFNFEAKNEDGVTMKAGWVIYDAPFGNAPAADQAVSNISGSPVVAPTLDYAYVIAPSLLGVDGLTLKTGYINAGDGGFGGDNFTNSGNTTFKPISLSYKIAGVGVVGFEDIVKGLTGEGDTNTEGGIAPFSAADGDKMASRVFFKGTNGDMSYGARYTMHVNGKAGVVKERKRNDIEAYFGGKFGIINAQAHFIMQDGEDTPGALATGDDADMGFYAHGLVGLMDGKLTTGLAIAMAMKGYTTGAEFDPTTLVDKALGAIPSTEKDDSMVLVVPVIFGVNDAVTARANLAFGNVGVTSGSESYSELDLGVDYALGKQTTLSGDFAYGTGDLVKKTATPGSEDDLMYLGWKIAVDF